MNTPATIDDFGENRFVSRLNRRFSSLLRWMFRIPESWEADPDDQFRRFLSRLNLRALALLLAVGVIATVVCAIMAIKQDSSALFFGALAVIPAVFVTQFIVSLFCSANLNLTFGRPVRLQSRLVPEMLKVFGVISLVYVVVSGVIAAIGAFNLSLQAGIAVSIAVLGAAVVAYFQPWLAGNCESLLGIEVGDDPPQSPGDYLFSLLIFFARYSLALVPVQFALGVAVLAALGVYAAILVLVVDDGTLEMGAMALSSLPGAMGLGAFGTFWFLSFPVVLPIVAHFLYLIVLGIADFGSSFFRLVRSSEQIASLSETAMNSVESAPEE